MRPYDAVFLAIAAGILIERPRLWWLAVFAPLVSMAAHAMPLGSIAIPIAAVAAALLVPRFAPVAILLALPTYRDTSEMLQAMILWMVVSALIIGLEDRIVDETRRSPARNLAAGLLCVAVLYFSILPVTFL